MKLFDDFYKMEQKTKTEIGFDCQLTFNPQHVIFKAHFPGHPITPGVCLVQIAKELMEMHLDKKLVLRKVNNIKFLSVIKVSSVLSVVFAFSKIIQTDFGSTFSVLVAHDNVQFAKLNLEVI
ncbi:MAG: hydroxymyristoyl-ACP dehydratase [Bacteroidales bacterium]|jgi:3-hydroxyacyl-[acyl-carrier-protein] dehydratase|nr:hydroxymyristoyl-ACP dehydratase [Bacteroidales bacterium]